MLELKLRQNTPLPIFKFGSSPQNTYCFGPLGCLSEKDLLILHEILRPAAPQWKTVGLALGFLNHELTAIENKPLLVLEGDTGYFRALLSQWLKWAPPNHSFPTTEALAVALQRSGHEDLAFQLGKLG